MKTIRIIYRLGKPGNWIVALIMALILLPGGLYAEEGTAFLGVTVQALDEEGGDLQYGVRIVEVLEDSAAGKAGIKKEDILLFFNDEKIRRPMNLVEAVRDTRPGDKVKVVILREGKKKPLQVVMGKRESLLRDFTLGKYFSTAGRAYLGLYLQNLNSDLAEYFAVKAGDGVLVLEVEKESPAEKAGVRSGDVLASIDGKSVETTAAVIALLRDYEAGQTVTLAVVRKGKRRELEVELGKRSGLERFKIVPLPENESSHLHLHGIKMPIIMHNGPAVVIKERLERACEQIRQRLRNLRLKEPIFHRESREHLSRRYSSITTSV